jgi:hypothetical protein
VDGNRDRPLPARIEERGLLLNALDLLPKIENRRLKIGKALINGGCLRGRRGHE